MALQDICGFDTTSFCPSSMSRKDTTNFLGRGFKGDPISRWCGNPSPLEFYIPVHEYLSESPIEFGQVQPNLILNSDWTKPKEDDHLHHSLPSISIPLSISPSVSLPFPLGHGTTTLGFAFQGGVIAAADSRSSCSGQVACPASQKILPVHSHLVGTTSGTSADCALWKRILSRELRLYQLRNRRRLSTGGAAKLLSHMLHPFKGTELCVAATLCGWDGDEEVPSGGTEQDGGALERYGIIISGKGIDGNTQMIETSLQPTKGIHSSKVIKTSLQPTKGIHPTKVTETSLQPTKGIHPTKVIKTSLQPKKEMHPTNVTKTSLQSTATSDAKTQPTSSNKTTLMPIKTSKPSGPRLFYVCSDGLRLKGDLFSVGSGSPYAYSILDERIHWGLSVEEAVSIAREAVYRATHRDAYSGNNVDLYHVTAKGWRRRTREDLKEEYYREKERERKRVEERKKENEKNQTR